MTSDQYPLDAREASLLSKYRIAARTRWQELSSQFALVTHADRVLEIDPGDLQTAHEKLGVAYLHGLQLIAARGV